MTSDDFFKADEFLRTGDATGAAELLRGIVADNPEHVAAWRKLAEALSAIGEEAGAAEAESSANAAEANHYTEVGTKLLYHGSAERSRTCFERALEIDPDCIQAHWMLGDYHGQAGRRGEALVHFRRCMELAPSRQAPGYMAAAFGEGEKPVRAPDDYVVEYFDWYAHHFYEHLTERLKYVGPQVTAETLSVARPRGFGRVLDLGFGTGLVGVLLRAHADRLVGLDLSPEMLELARVRGVYDDLIEGEIVAKLSGMPDNSFDAVVASDVLIYSGDLESAFAQVRRVLADDGVFVATFEEAQDGEDWILSHTGRYLHSAAYLETVCRAAGFARISIEAAHLRKEYHVPVPSLAATFQVAG